MTVNVCIPILNRYDLAQRLLDSLISSTVTPCVHVIDNGQRCWRPRTDLQVEVLTPAVPMGLAESWNWFITHVPEERLITNDDIIFAPTSLEQLVGETAYFVSCTFGFSCFLLRDECVKRVGVFDEAISPGYAYFEDRDYLNRMREAGIQDKVIHCGVQHFHSQTFVGFTDEQKRAHHKKFVLAQENFLKKWGKLPADLERQKA